jgi:hypothetical protein
MSEIGPSSIQSDQMDVWIVSHGGVASNAICDYLQEQGLRTRPENYHLICHKQHPGVPLGIPIVVVYGDYESAIRSMHRRGFLEANATKLRFGMNLPEVNLKRLLSNYPEDPLGIKQFLSSFKEAKDSDLDSIQFLKYPYDINAAKVVFDNLGLPVDLSTFELRDRKKNWRRTSTEVSKIIDIYKKYSFEE